MKEAIQHIEVIADEWAEKAKDHRVIGDHIKATRLEKLAKNLRKIAKLARIIYLK